MIDVLSADRTRNGSPKLKSVWVAHWKRSIATATSRDSKKSVDAKEVII